jgi:hypothetical protein
MKKTLYLLRKPIDQIDSALFHPTKSQGDVVLLEENGRRMFPYEGGVVFSLTNDEADDGLTYDGLVKKIFEYDHTVLI